MLCDSPSSWREVECTPSAEKEWYHLLQNNGWPGFPASSLHTRCSLWKSTKNWTGRKQWDEQMPTCHLAASALGQVLGKKKSLLLGATCFSSHFGKCSFGASFIEDLTSKMYLSEFWVRRRSLYFDNWLVWFCYSFVILLLLNVRLICDWSTI